VPHQRIEPFADRYLDAAGDLLAARHRRHRAVVPLLPARYEDAAAARAQVEMLWRTDDTPGAVAVENGRVVAYVIGLRKEDDAWGPNVWVDPAGHAATPAEDLRDVYAAVADRWVAAGRKAHYAVVPAGDCELVDAWQRLGFGHQTAYGIREISVVAWPEGTRKARLDDVDALVELHSSLSQHHRASPVFAIRGTQEDTEELRKEFEENLSRDDVGVLVAEQDRRVVGYFQVEPVETSMRHSGVARVGGSALLSMAVTRPEVRGRGAGVKLMQAALAWAAERGYETMTTDWRVTNLLSSRFWPMRGFSPTFFRLHRLIA
jgi:GNAT superfamily N-acetyltransferase